MEVRPMWASCSLSTREKQSNTLTSYYSYSVIFNRNHIDHLDRHHRLQKKYWRASEYLGILFN